METTAQESSQKQYLSQVLQNYSKDKKFFCEALHFRAIGSIASGIRNVHLEIMDLSESFLNESRLCESEEKAKEQRDISFELRKIAQKIYLKYNLTDDSRFLKFVE